MNHLQETTNNDGLCKKTVSRGPGGVMGSMMGGGRVRRRKTVGVKQHVVMLAWWYLLVVAMLLTRGSNAQEIVALPETDGPPPFTHMVYFMFDFAFEPETARDPTAAELSAMLCHTTDYIHKRTTDQMATLGDYSPITINTWYISWQYDATQDMPLKVNFHADIRYADDSAFVDKQTVFDSFHLTPEDVAHFIENYIWKVDVNNVFYFAVSAAYRLGFVQPIGETYKIERGNQDQCAPQDEIAAPATVSMAYFVFDYAFEPVAGLTREPTVEELDAMLCVTNDYIKDRVSNTLSDGKPLKVRDWYINWVFDETKELPLTVNFHADIRYEDSGESADKQAVFHSFDLSTDDIAEYIKNYIWTVDMENVFYYTIMVNYKIRFTEPVGEYKLETSHCEEQGTTRPPTIAPVPTPAPKPSPDLFYVPTTLPPTRSPTRSPTTASPTTVNPTMSTPAATEASITTVAPTPLSSSSGSPPLPPLATFPPVAAAADDPRASKPPNGTNPNDDSSTPPSPTASTTTNSPGFDPQTHPSATTAPTTLTATPGGSPAPGTTASPSPIGAGNSGGASATGLPATPSPGTTTPTVTPGLPSASPTINPGPPPAALDNGSSLGPTSNPTVTPGSSPTTSPSSTSSTTSATGLTTTTNPTVTPGNPTGTPSSGPSTAGAGGSPTASPTTADPSANATTTSTTSPAANQTETPESPTGSPTNSTSSPDAVTSNPTVTPGSPTTASPTSDASRTGMTSPPPGSLSPSGTSPPTSVDPSEGTPGASEGTGAGATSEVGVFAPVSYRMEFTWRDTRHASTEPTKQEINDLLCFTNIFMNERLKVAIGNDIVLSDITNGNWRHIVAGSQGQEVLRVTVDMTLTAVYGSALDPIPSNVVVMALKTAEDGLSQYLTSTNEGGESLFGEEDHLFQHFNHMSLRNYPLGTEMEEGQIPEVKECPEPKFLPSPDVLGQRLDPGLLAGMPGPDDSKDDQTDAPSEIPNSDHGFNAIVPPEDYTQPIRVSFIVSNLEDITAPADVNRSGLGDAFPFFVIGLLDDLHQIVGGGRTRYLRSSSNGGVELQGARRELQDAGFTYVVGSAGVRTITEIHCSEDSHPSLTCHEVHAGYELSVHPLAKRRLEDSNPLDRWESFVLRETNRAVHDGRLYSVMKARSPDTPLFIGEIPPPTGSGGNSPIGLMWGLIIGLIALVLLVCLLCCCIIAVRKHRDKEALQEEALLDKQGSETETSKYDNHKVTSDRRASKFVDHEDSEDEESQHGFVDVSLSTHAAEVEEELGNDATPALALVPFKLPPSSLKEKCSESTYGSMSKGNKTETEVLSNRGSSEVNTVLEGDDVIRDEIASVPFASTPANDCAREDVETGDNIDATSDNDASSQFDDEGSEDIDWGESEDFNPDEDLNLEQEHNTLLLEHNQNNDRLVSMGLQAQEDAEQTEKDQSCNHALAA